MINFPSKLHTYDEIEGWRSLHKAANLFIVKFTTLWGAIKKKVRRRKVSGFSAFSFLVPKYFCFYNISLKIENTFHKLSTQEASALHASESPNSLWIDQI